MMKKITFELDLCHHIPEKSCYNNNYYITPVTINGTTLLYEKCDEFADTLHFYLVYDDGTKVLVFQDRWSSHPIVEINLDDNGIPIPESFWT